MGNRLTALAGPKVFTSRERRFSSLCFGTVKVPQSAEVASGEAVLNGREVARAARRSIDVALGRLREGDALVLFAEGTRSRTGEMQSMLAGAARYLEVPGTWLLPAGLTGSEALFPVDVSAPRPARVVLHLGRPMRAGALVALADGDRRLIMDAIGLAVAETLPADTGVSIDTRTAFRRRSVSFMIRETRHDIRLHPTPLAGGVVTARGARVNRTVMRRDSTRRRKNGTLASEGTEPNGGRRTNETRADSEAGSQARRDEGPGVRLDGAWRCWAGE